MKNEQATKTPPSWLNHELNSPTSCFAEMSLSNFLKMTDSMADFFDIKLKLKIVPLEEATQNDEISG